MRRKLEKNRYSFGQTVYRTVVRNGEVFVEEAEVLGLLYNDGLYSYHLVGKTQDGEWVAEGNIFDSVESLLDDLRKKVV